MNRLETFKKVIAERGVHNKLDISSGQVRQFRYMLKNGQHITEDSMRSVLEKYGAKIKQEEEWVLD